MPNRDNKKRSDNDILNDFLTVSEHKLLSATILDDNLRHTNNYDILLDEYLEKYHDDIKRYKLDNGYFIVQTFFSWFFIFLLIFVLYFYRDTKIVSSLYDSFVRSVVLTGASLIDDSFGTNLENNIRHSFKESDLEIKRKKDLYNSYNDISPVGGLVPVNPSSHSLPLHEEISKVSYSPVIKKDIVLNSLSYSGLFDGFYCVDGICTLDFIPDSKSNLSDTSLFISYSYINVGMSKDIGDFVSGECEKKSRGYECTLK